MRDEHGVSAVVVDMTLGVQVDAEAGLDALDARQLGHVMNLLAAANAEVVANSLDGQTVSCLGKSRLHV